MRRDTGVKCNMSSYETIQLKILKCHGGAWIVAFKRNTEDTGVLGGRRTSSWEREPRLCEQRHSLIDRLYSLDLFVSVSDVTCTGPGQTEYSHTSPRRLATATLVCE